MELCQAGYLFQRTCRQPELRGSDAALGGSAQRQPEALLAVKHNEGMAGELQGIRRRLWEEKGDDVQNKVHVGHNRKPERCQGTWGEEYFFSLPAVHSRSLNTRGRRRIWGSSGWPMSKTIREPRRSALVIAISCELLGYNNGSFTALLSCVLKKKSFSFQLI